MTHKSGTAANDAVIKTQKISYLSKKNKEYKQWKRVSLCPRISKMPTK